MPVGTLVKHSLKGFTLKTDMYRLLRSSLCSLANDGDFRNNKA